MASWLPRSAVVALITVVGLALLNFATFATSMGGQPEDHDGRYYADDHGVLTELTAAQYDQAERTGARGFSGHAAAFASFGAAFMLASSRRRWADRNADMFPRTHA